MTFTRLLIFLIFFSTTIFSCKTEDNKETETAVKSEISVENLDQHLFASKSVSDVQLFLNKHSYLLPLYFAESQIDSAQLAAHLFNILQNPGFQNFRSQVDSIISNRNDNIIAPLDKAFKKNKKFLS